MKLIDEQIRKITKGVCAVEQEEGYLRFLRFPKEVLAKLSAIGEEKRIQTLVPSGVRFDFYTDSTELKIGVKTNYVTGNFELWVDGELTAVGGASDRDEACEKCVEFKMKDGKKHVVLYFPTYGIARLSSVELSDNSWFEPREDKDFAVFFGDSITQGYTTHWASLNYVSRLSRKMDVDFHNFAISGDIFNTVVTEACLDRKPKYVFVSYGTNDWGCGKFSPAEFKKNMRDFFVQVCLKYPESRIIDILPIWRADGYTDAWYPFKFEEIFGLMREVLREFKTVEVIDGLKLVPHVPALFADKMLHPNETGFEFYADGIFKYLSQNS